MIASQLTFNLFKVNNKNSRKKCEIWLKLTIKTPERRQWRRSGVFTVNFEHTSHLFLVFLLLTLNNQMLAGLCVSKVSWKIRIPTIHNFRAVNY